jgi:O-antigen/teichoic acid export membrane protein
VGAVAFCAAVSIVIFSDILATYWIGNNGLPHQTVADALKFVGCLIGLRLIEGIYRSTLLGLNLHVQLNIATSLLATGKGLGAVGVLQWISADITTFFAWQVILALISILFYAILVYRHLGSSPFSGRGSVALIKAVWGFAGGMFFISLLSMVTIQVDKVILTRVLSLKDFAQYMLAATVAGGVFFLAVPITQTYHAKFCIVLNTSKHELTSLFHLASQMMVAVVGGVALVIVMNSEIVLNLWTNDPDLSKNVSPLLAGLLLGNFLNCLSLIPYQLQLANGWTGLTVKINIAGFVFIIIAMPIIAPKYGAIAAAYIWIFINFFFFVVGTNLMFRRLLTAERWRWYFDDVIRPSLAVLTIAIFSKGLLALTTDSLLLATLLVFSCALATAAAVFVSPLLRSRFISYIEGPLIRIKP